MRSIFHYNMLTVILFFFCIHETFTKNLSDSHTVPNVKYIFSINQQSENDKTQGNDVVLVYPNKIKNDNTIITIIEPSKNVTLLQTNSNITSSKHETVEETNNVNTPRTKSNQISDHTTKSPLNITLPKLKTEQPVPVKPVKSISDNESEYLTKLKKLKETIYKRPHINNLKNSKLDVDKTNMVKVDAESKNITDIHIINTTLSKEHIEDTNLTMNISNEVQVQNDNSKITNNPIMNNEVTSFDSWKALDVIPFTIEDAIIPAESEIKLNYVPFIKKSVKEDAVKKLIKKPLPLVKEKHYIKYNPKLNVRKQQTGISSDSITETRNIDDITLNSKDLLKNSDYHIKNSNSDNFSNSHYVLAPNNPTMIRGLLIIGPIPKSLPENISR